MNKNIKIKRIWIIITFIGIILFFYGWIEYSIFLEILGAMLSVGAMISGVSIRIIRNMRRKRGQRYD